MISGGLTLLRALTILSEQTENKLLAETIKHVSEDVEGGASLSEAMTKYPKAFNQLYVSLVRAGETGGQLETVLTRVADTYEAEYKLRQKVKSAMTYPVVVAFIAVSLLIVMLIFIVPTFAAMFDDLGGKLPLPTQILVTMSENARVLVPLFIIGIVAARIIYKRLRKSNEKARPLLRQGQTEDPGLRRAVSQDRDVPIHPDAQLAAEGRSAGAPVAGDHG